MRRADTEVTAEAEAEAEAEAGGTAGLWWQDGAEHGAAGAESAEVRSNATASGLVQPLPGPSGNGTALRSGAEEPSAAVVEGFWDSVEGAGDAEFYDWDQSEYDDLWSTEGLEEMRNGGDGRLYYPPSSAPYPNGSESDPMVWAQQLAGWDDGREEQAWGSPGTVADQGQGQYDYYDRGPGLPEDWLAGETPPYASEGGDRYNDDDDGGTWRLRPSTTLLGRAFARVRAYRDKVARRFAEAATFARNVRAAAAWGREEARRRRREHFQKSQEIGSRVVAEYAAKLRSFLEQLPERVELARMDMCPGPLYQKPFKETGGTMVVNRWGEVYFDERTAKKQLVCGFTLVQLQKVLLAESAIFLGIGEIVGGLENMQNSFFELLDAIKDPCTWDPGHSIQCRIRGQTLVIPVNSWILGDGGSNLGSLNSILRLFGFGGFGFWGINNVQDAPSELVDRSI